MLTDFKNSSHYAVNLVWSRSRHPAVPQACRYTILWNVWNSQCHVFGSSCIYVHDCLVHMKEINVLNFC